MEAMLAIYCRDKHRPAGDLCPACRRLLAYADVRLERCVFQEDKPTCAQCPVHCYRESEREQVRRVMRHAGPRMLWEHPVLALRHWWDGFSRRGKTPKPRRPAPLRPPAPKPDGAPPPGQA